jgi:peptide subunit release factor 1 (eRF1)
MLTGAVKMLKKSGNEINISGLEEVYDYMSPGNHVVSAYLLVDGLRTSRKDYLTRLNSMIKEKKTSLDKSADLDRNQKKKVASALDKVKVYLSEKFKSDSTRTVIIFASTDGFWKEIRLPFILRSRIVIDPKPYIQNLRAYLKNYKSYGILLIDREKAKIYSAYLNEIREYLAAFISDVPSRVNYRSQSVLREKKILSRHEEKLHHFFKTINDRTLELFRERKFDYLILAGRNKIISGFNNYLHSYLQLKYIGKIDAEPDSSINLIKSKAIEVIDLFELKNKNKLIDDLIDEYNPNRLGVLGIDAVIKALIRDQIRILIYDRNFSHSGYVCRNCSYLSANPVESCPYCEGKLVFYNEIVDEIVENALDQGCEIVDLEGNERFKKAGSIGAVLRYVYER